MQSHLTSTIKALTPNMQGHDYFVGDIHGNFEGLRQALDAVGFKSNKDRLIAVGDLVDRQPRGDLAMHWLKAPFFHSIRGNHEDLYLKWRSLKNDIDAQEDYEERLYFRGSNGGDWVKKYDESVHCVLEEALSQLPYFLSVPLPDGKVIGVVHAEFPDNTCWPRVIMSLLDRNEDLIDSMTWGRERWRSARKQQDPFEDKNQIFGLDAVVCGHVRVPHPLALGNIVYLDTGGWLERGKFSILRSDEILAMAEAETGDALPSSYQIDDEEEQTTDEAAKQALLGQK